MTIGVGTSAVRGLLGLVMMALFLFGFGFGQTPVGSCADLANINNDLGASYVLTTDLDCTADGNTIMIGSHANPFTGIFDGSGFVVTVNIDSGTANHIGLFRLIHNAYISHLGISGFVQGNAYVGGLAGGVSNSLIDNSYSTSVVSGNLYTVGGLAGYVNSGIVENSYAYSTVSSPSNVVGGLIGHLYGGSVVVGSHASGSVQGQISAGGLIGRSENSTVMDSYAGGFVVGNNDAGGLVGFISNSEIENSYAIADVSGSRNIGGLIGNATNSTVIQSYALSDVSGTANIGGLMGYAEGKKNDNTIAISYASGVVSGVDDVGGLVGNAWNVIVEDSYTLGAISGVNHIGGFFGALEEVLIYRSYAAISFLSNTDTGGLIGHDYGDSQIVSSFWDNDLGGSVSAGGTGLSTIAMKDILSYVGRNIQITGIDFNDGYPFLTRQLGDDTPVWYIAEEVEDDDDFVGGDGSEENPYQIATCGQLQNIHNDLGAHYRLIQDVDCSDTINWTNDYGTGFLPIARQGGFDVEEAGFSGSLNGSGYAISGLYMEYIESPDTFDGVDLYNGPTQYGPIGLFYVVSQGSIANLTLVNPIIVGQYYVGGFAGIASFSTLSDVSVTSGYIRALHGVFAGGIVGIGMGLDIQGCFLSGKVRGSGVFIGGVAGYLAASNVSTCLLYTDVDGGAAVGGVVGISAESIFDQVSVYGDIVGGDLNIDGDNRDNFYGSENLSKSEDMCIGGIIGSDGGGFFLGQADVASTITGDQFFGSIIDNTYGTTATTGDQTGCVFVSNNGSSSDIPFGVTGILIDDFETGDFSLRDWTNDQDRPWIIVDDEDVYSGNYSVRGGDMEEADDVASILTLDYDFYSSGWLSFYTKVSSENCCDGLEIYLNASQLNIDDGEIVTDRYTHNTGWIQLRVYIHSSGNHTLEFSYVKDGSITNGSDTIWIDDLYFVPNQYDVDEEEEQQGGFPYGFGGGGGGSSFVSPTLPKFTLNPITKKTPSDFCKDRSHGSAPISFQDVKGTRYDEAVNVLVSHCLVQGYSNVGQEFGINNPLTVGELYKVFALMGMLDIDMSVGGFGWSYGYKIAGEKAGLWNGINFAREEHAFVTEAALLQVAFNYMYSMGLINELPMVKGSNKSMTRGSFARFVNVVLGLVSTK